MLTFRVHNNTANREIGRRCQVGNLQAVGSEATEPTSKGSPDIQEKNGYYSFTYLGRWKLFIFLAELQVVNEWSTSPCFQHMLLVIIGAQSRKYNELNEPFRIFSKVHDAQVCLFLFVS
jgi:hypothetical protein